MLPTYTTNGSFYNSTLLLLPGCHSKLPTAQGPFAVSSALASPLHKSGIHCNFAPLRSPIPSSAYCTHFTTVGSRFPSTAPPTACKDPHRKATRRGSPSAFCCKQLTRISSIVVTLLLLLFIALEHTDSQNISRRTHADPF